MKVYLNNDNIYDSVNYEDVISINLVDLEIDNEITNIINSCINLEELYLTRCDLSINNMNNYNIRILHMDSCIILDTNFLNNYTNLEELYYQNNKALDLKRFNIIKQLKVLSVRNTKVINEDYMVLMDKIEMLDLCDSNVSDLSTLINSETLKILMIDKRQYKKNSKFIKLFENTQILDENGDHYEYA